MKPERHRSVTGCYIIEIDDEPVGLLLRHRGRLVFHATRPEARALEQRRFRRAGSAEHAARELLKRRLVGGHGRRS